MQMEDDEFTREPLDATKPPLVSSAKEWMGSVFNALSGPRGQRIARRTVLAAGLCALLAITVLVGTGDAGRLWRQARFAWLQHNAPTLTRSTITPQAFSQRSLSGWQRQPSVMLPDGIFSWFTQAPDDPQTFYGCSAAQPDANGYQQDGPLTFWYSHDAGAQWSSVPIPGTKATSCFVTVAPDAPSHIGLESQYAGATPAQNVGCSQLAVFLSMDGGAHWHALPSLPDAPIQAGHNTYCSVSLWPSARHLYLFYDYSRWSGRPDHPTWTGGTSLARSDDGGQTWKRLDENLPPESDESFDPRLLDDGETLLASVNHFDSPAQSKLPHVDTWLWVSRDAGDSWEPLADMRDFGTQRMLLPADARSAAPSPTQPLYLINSASGPSLLYRIQIAQVSNLRHWEPLPPLPIAGATPEHLGITTVLTETAAGNLLVFGLGPDDHVPSSNEQQSTGHRPAEQWLWEWNPQGRRWTLLRPALDIPWPQCSDHCWNGWLTPGDGTDGAGAYLWVMGFDLDANGTAHTVVFRTLLSGKA